MKTWIGSALLSLGLLAAPAQAASKPNIVFIMADDLGFAEVGYRGSPIKTPNIDKLATEGVRMDSFYGAAVCTPARAELMTGRYPIRYGLQTLVIFPSHTYGLATDERTLPQALKDAGYTTLMDGKWHVGHADKKYWPQNRGFDYFYGNVVGEIDYFTHARGGVVDWQRNGKFLNEPGYYMDLIGDDAVRLIDEQDGKTSFFLYFASLAPHAPYQVTQKYKDLYPSVTGKSQQAYMGMISSLDDQVGRIVAELGEEAFPRQHDHPVRQRQWRRDERPVCERAGKRLGGARGFRGRIATGRKGARLEHAAQRRQGKSARGGRPRAGVRQLAWTSAAAYGHRAALHGRHHADAARACRRPRRSRPSIRRQGHLAGAGARLAVAA